MTYAHVLTPREAGRWALPAYAALRRRVRVLACAHAREAGACTVRILDASGSVLESIELIREASGVMRTTLVTRSV